jgi:putative membrane protein
METIFNLRALTDSILFSLVGIVILVVSFVIIEKITPENIYKKVVEQGNVAVAIVIAAFIVAMAIIISAAMHG